LKRLENVARHKMTHEDRKKIMIRLPWLRGLKQHARKVFLKSMVKLSKRRKKNEKKKLDSPKS